MWVVVYNRWVYLVCVFWRSVIQYRSKMNARGSNNYLPNPRTVMYLALDIFVLQERVWALEDGPQFFYEVTPSAEFCESNLNTMAFEWTYLFKNGA